MSTDSSCCTRENTTTSKRATWQDTERTVTESGAAHTTKKSYVAQLPDGRAC